jgi:hypothetical protein
MRGWIMIVAVFGGIFALCWYGATGETGPMGWFNSMQAGNGGSYHRGVSFMLTCLCGVVVAAPVLGLWAVLTRKSRARAGGASASLTAPADAKVAALQAVMNDSSSWRWRTIFKIWLVGVVLLCGVVLAWNAWDFHGRSADAFSDYTPVRLGGTAPAARPDDGSHLALQGRLLWDRGVTRKTTINGRDHEDVFVPVAGADWRPGDAVQFVVQIDRSLAWALRNRADGPEAPLLVRVEGAIPTPSRAVFERAEAPPSDAAVLVEVVRSQAGQVSDAHPTFDWAFTQGLCLALAGIWTFGLFFGVLARFAKDRQQRRRQARRAA